MATPRQRALTAGATRDAVTDAVNAINSGLSASLSDMPTTKDPEIQLWYEIQSLSAAVVTLSNYVQQLASISAGHTSAIDAVEADVATNTTDIADHETRIAALETP